METSDQAAVNSGTKKPAPPASSVNSLRELLNIISGRFPSQLSQLEPTGIAEVSTYPFFAIVGQMEMRLALILCIINPAIKGLLLIGPRGTGKTTAVRSLLTLMPTINRSSCVYGCLPEDILANGMDAVCPDCAKRYSEGQSLTITDQVHLIELPISAKIDDVVGGLDERELSHERFRLRRGTLALSDHNILYIDEVNLVSDEIINCTLDAAAQGKYTIRRGPYSATYNSRFTLIGSMNPEEGNLRPQIMDRFGLRIIVNRMTDAEDRLEVYKRVSDFQNHPTQTSLRFEPVTLVAKQEIQTARDLLPSIDIPDEVARFGIKIIQALEISSLRAELTLLETARAYAAADGRNSVVFSDIQSVAPMSLRLRHSEFMVNYFQQIYQEEQKIQEAIAKASQSA